MRPLAHDSNIKSFSNLVLYSNDSSFTLGFTKILISQLSNPTENRDQEPGTRKESSICWMTFLYKTSIYKLQFLAQMSWTPMVLDRHGLPPVHSAGPLQVLTPHAFT